MEIQCKFLQTFWLHEHNTRLWKKWEETFVWSNFANNNSYQNSANDGTQKKSRPRSWTLLHSFRIPLKARREFYFERGKNKPSRCLSKFLYGNNALKCAALNKSQLKFSRSQRDRIWIAAPFRFRAESGFDFVECHWRPGDGRAATGLVKKFNISLRASWESNTWQSFAGHSFGMCSVPILMDSHGGPLHQNTH